VGDLSVMLGDRILEKRKDAVAEQDWVRRWVEERLRESRPDDFLSKDVVRSDFEVWKALSGVKWSEETFLAELTRGLASGRWGIVRKVVRPRLEDGRARGWMGIKLVSEMGVQL